MATKTIQTMQCRRCGAWLKPGGPTVSQGSCDEGKRHNFVKRDREVEATPRETIAAGGECILCGGIGGYFCPMSVDGEGPHRRY